MDNGAYNYRRFLEGNESAFVEIMNEYREGLIFFINRYLNDLHAAEDISMDCFVDLLVHRYLRRRFLQEKVKQVKLEVYFIAKFRAKKPLFLFTEKVYNAKKHCQVKTEKSL